MLARLFVDMDGTLTKFSYVPTEKLYEENYFRNLEPNRNVLLGLKAFLEKYRDDVQVEILSNYLTDSSTALAEKTAWLKAHAPFLEKYGCTFHFVPCGVDKKTEVPNDGKLNILLDDHSPNLISFCEAENNDGIKLINDVNGEGEKWKGLRIDSRLSPEEFSLNLISLIIIQLLSHTSVI